MAQHRGRQGEWPTVKRNPEATFQATGVIERSDLSVAGPLRSGTAPGVGPRGPAGPAGRSERSDFGMDRVSPREFDPFGTSTTRGASFPSSDLIAKRKRE
jgi:hypothetical protein